MRKLMSEATAVQLEKVLPGFRSAMEWNKIFKVTLHHTRERLNLLTSQGKLERKIFRVKSGMVIRKVAHYRLIRNPRRPSATH